MTDSGEALNQFTPGDEEITLVCKFPTKVIVAIVLTVEEETTGVEWEARTERVSW